MKIEDVRRILDQIEKIAPSVDVRIVVPHTAVQQHLASIGAIPVHQDSAWNSDEVVFKDIKLDLQKSETT